MRLSGRKASRFTRSWAPPQRIVLFSLLGLNAAAFIVQLVLLSWNQPFVREYLALSDRGINDAYAWQFFTAPLLYNNIWHFAADKRPEPRKKDLAAKGRKNGAVKIDGQMDRKRDGPFDGLNEKRQNPPPPGPAIAVKFGPDGSFRQTNQLTQLDRLNPDNQRHKLYALRMEANRTYEIDMTSNEFDAYLNVVDDTGRIVAADDDSGGDLNARIIFTPARGGLFHIEATHFPQELQPDVPTTGKYTLIIRRR